MHTTQKHTHMFMLVYRCKEYYVPWTYENKDFERSRNLDGLATNKTLDRIRGIIYPIYYVFIFSSSLFFLLLTF